MKTLCRLLITASLIWGEAASVRILLVGDSTMAVKSGWGSGFCGEIVTPQVTCLNMAKGGRSSASYREEGSWEEVIKVLKTPGDFAATYVLIQFGHNDQPGKPGRSTDLATQFPVNIRHYVDEVLGAGARPVLVTPLTRRSFREGKLNDNLGPWAEATRKVAAEAKVPLRRPQRRQHQSRAKDGFRRSRHARCCPQARPSLRLHSPRPEGFLLLRPYGGRRVGGGRSRIASLCKAVVYSDHHLW